METSAKRVEANRRNARRSTGPRTVAGKSASAVNARRHGLLSESMLIPGEDPAEFWRFAAELRKSLNPHSALASVFADQIVRHLWRLRRFATAEAKQLNVKYYQAIEERHAGREFSIRMTEVSGQYSDGALSTELAAVQEKKRQAHEEATKLENALGIAFLRAGDDLLKLSRYETASERNLLRDLHEFQRLEAAENGQAVPLPRAVDVLLDGATEGAEIDREIAAQPEAIDITSDKPGTGDA